MIYTNSLTSKGQITIPKALRVKIGLKPGQSARIELSDDRTISIKAPISSELTRKLVGKPSHKQPLSAKEKTSIAARGL